MVKIKMGTFYRECFSFCFPFPPKLPASSCNYTFNSGLAENQFRAHCCIVVFIFPYRNVLERQKGGSDFQSLREGRIQLKRETTALSVPLPGERSSSRWTWGSKPPDTGRRPQAIRKTISPEYGSVEGGRGKGGKRLPETEATRGC